MVNLMDNENLTNSGGYFIVKKEGIVTYSKEKPLNIKIIDKAYVEEVLYNSSLEVIKEFAKKEHNKDVYVVVIDVTTEHLGLSVYINTIEGLENTYKHYGKRPKDLMYAAGDFEYMFTDNIPNDANIISEVYSKISYGWEFLDIDEDVAVKNEIFDEEVVKMGLKITERLEKETRLLLDITDNFIMFYCDHDSDFFYNDEYKKIYDESFESND